MIYKVVFTYKENSESWEVLYLNDIIMDIVKERLKNGWSVKIEKL